MLAPNQTTQPILPAEPFATGRLVEAAHVLGDNPVLVLEWHTRRILACNDAVTRVFGFNPKELLGHDTRCLHVSDRAFESFGIESEPFLQSANNTYHCRYRMRRKDGSEFPSENIVQIIHDLEQGRVAVVGFVRDLSGCESLDLPDQGLGLDSTHTLSMEIPGAVFRRIRDVHGNDRYTYLTGQLVNELGIDPSAARQDPSQVFDLMESNDRQLLESAIQATAKSGSGIDLVVRFHSPSRKEFWVRIISRPTRLDNGAIVWDGLAIDISAEKKAQAHAAWLANHDRLTGLLNRAEFMAHLERALDAADKHSQHIVLAQVAVRGMFKVNEAHGLPGGDTLLRQIADRLDNTLPEGSIIARSHGDVFLVKLEIPDNDDNLAAGVRKLQSALDAPFDLGDPNPAHISVSIGIARYPEDADTTEGLLRAVALAGDRAHKQPEVDYEFYNRERSETMRQRFRLEASLRQAIAEGQLEPYYQPQISLSDGSLVGLEALVRWPQEDGRLMMPGAFIPLAEEVGLSGKIGRLMLRRVAHDLRTWSENGGTIVPVAVNCSARQFRDTELVRAYEQEVLEQGLEPELIHLELTESSLVDNYDNAKRIMDHLNAMGVKFSIDDFGTGFSALSHLSRLPFQVLKIDRSFVAGILDDAHQRNVVQGLIQMASTIGLYIIAEGVETAEQEAALRRMGSNAAQGFYYSPALPAADIRHWHPPENL